MLPTLLVHGIWDTGAELRTLKAGLLARGVPQVECLDLVPNDGRASIAELATSVERAAEALGDRGPIDLVGFSMGALVSRYFIQRLSGKARVRRFVSISGPHAGTYTAMAMPTRLGRLDLRGIGDMRPGSALLRGLSADADPFGPVEVHVLYTPYDLMIVPATSSVLPGARTQTVIPVALHRQMITHPRAVAKVADLLTEVREK